MDALLMWFAAAAVVAVVALMVLKWASESVTGDIITGVQGLVDKMKEYDLDTRAGLLICQGAELRIQYMDPALKGILGSPTFVDDILPLSARERHRLLVARYVGPQPLPDSLNHPLRNVQILNKENNIIQAKLIIGKMGDRRSMLADILYVIVQPNDASMSRRSSSGSVVPFPHKRLPSAPAARAMQRCPSSCSYSTVRSVELMQATDLWKSDIFDTVEEIHDTIDLNSDDSKRNCDQIPRENSVKDGGEGKDEDFQGMVEVYGMGAASYIDRGLVPATERYAQATVLYMDIVDFTRHCMAKQLDEISGWMTRIHATIDELLERYAIRKVETRGDCVICVSGTNFVPTEGGASRDLCGDQATRMLSFGHDLGLALSAIDGTAARMGIATGPVVLTHIAHGGDTLPAKYIYGDTVNVACRMEQTGRVGAVQLTEAAARTYAEEQGTAVPPLRTKEIKGKGTMRVALYDYVARRFLDEVGGGSAGGGAAALDLEASQGC